MTVYIVILAALVIGYVIGVISERRRYMKRFERYGKRRR